MKNKKQRRNFKEIQRNLKEIQKLLGITPKRWKIYEPSYEEWQVHVDGECIFPSR